MRRRDIRPGMAVVHSRSRKPLGTVTSVGRYIIRGEYPNGDPWIADPSELSPRIRF